MKRNPDSGWTDDAGTVHTIRQAEGGEQGCPLMPALYSLAQHDALAAADAELLPSEVVLSFLDDLYIVTSRDRAGAAFREVATSVESRAGVQTNLGKLRAWSSGGGPAPPSLASLGPDVWTSDKTPAENGIKVLGTPIGQPAYVDSFATTRVETENRLLKQLVKLPDLQCAWIMLSMSAAPRSNHMVRMLPPSQARTYAQQHDIAMWSTLCDMLHAGTLQADELARDIATLPGRFGGLGLRSAERSSARAYWA